MTSLFFKKLQAVSREAIAVCAACVILIGCGSSSGSQDGRTLRTGTPTAAQLTGDDGVNRWNILGDTTGTDPLMNLILTSPINGAGGIDEVRIESETAADALDGVARDGTVTSITFDSEAAQATGVLRLQNIEILTIADSGTVTGTIDASTVTTAMTFQFDGGTVGGAVTGGTVVDTFNFNGGTVSAVNGGTGNDIFNFIGGTVGGAVNGDAGDDTFAVTGSITGTTPALTISAALDGGDGDDTFWLNEGGVVTNIASATAAGDVNLQNFETITINGGMVSGNIAAADSTTAINVMSGTVTGTITGGAMATTFTFAGGTVTGAVTGGAAVDTFNFNGGTVGAVAGGDGANTFTFAGGTVTGAVTGGAGVDTFVVAGNIVDTPTDATGPALAIGMALVGGDDANIIDAFWLNMGGEVNDILAGNTDPATDDVSLHQFEAITINGGTVNENIVAADTTATITVQNVTVMGAEGEDDTIVMGTVTGNITGSATATTFTISGGTVGGNITGGAGADTFNVSGGTVTGNITGGAEVDTFVLSGGQVDGNVTGGAGDDIFRLSGTMFAATSVIDGGDGTGDVLQYDGGATAQTAGNNAFAGAAFGLGDDTDITDNVATTGRVMNVETQADIPAPSGTSLSTTGVAVPRVSGFEALSLSPALNLYGAMSDALMQFGQQTATGFGLADLDLSAGGRGTSLVSKDSPFSKGRIWAHQIEHSGSGKGTIGLNITGLTARADSDYDYQMTLNQHGLDAPLATSKWGALNLRAVSHTMTGIIETNVAEANVTGYGAGVSMLWNSNGGTLSAHVTSLASAYEVDAHTSQLNPRAVVSEVSEGDFSAFNAVISAGVADTRKIAEGLSLRTTADMSWQTLSLDDFSETGADGIAVNFDKATRFAARIGAGLEAQNWFSDVAFVHETSSGGTLSSGLQQDYKQEDGTAIEMRFGGKVADLAEGLTLKAYAGMRASLIGGGSIDPSARFDLNWRF